MKNTRQTRDIAIAAGFAALACLVSRMPWQPAVSHTLATCAILGLGALAVTAPGPPRVFPTRRAVAFLAPLALGLPLAAGATVLLVGPLDVPWSSPTRLAPDTALVVALVPLVEEAFFRGALLRALPGRPVLGALFSSVLFGALHLQLGWWQAGGMAIAGLVLCALALATRSLVVPMVLHGVFNGLAAGYQERQPGTLAVAALVALALALVGGWWRRSTR